MDEKRKKVKKSPSPFCFYIAGGVFLAYSLFLPFYKTGHYIMGAAAAAAAGLISAALLPKTETVIKEQPKATGDSAADAAIAEGRRYLDTLDGIRDGLPQCRMKELLSSIDTTTEKILEAIGDAPSKAPMIRRLLSYYLPTLIKLSSFYLDICEKGGEGENIRTSRERIESNTELLDSALKKQLDLLYESDVIDITADIAVMENILAQEGLSEGLGDKLKQTGGQ